MPKIEFKQVVEASPIAFYTTDIKGRLTFYNKAAADLWGRSPELGSNLWSGSWKIFYPDGKPMSHEQDPMARTLKDGRAYKNERMIIERPDNSYRNLMVFPQPIFDEEGNLTGAHNTLVDITEHQNYEIKQATLSAIVESSEDAIISKDLNGTIMSWNAGAEQIFGYKESEVLGKSITILIPEGRIQEENLILDKIRRGERVHHFETIRKDKFDNELPISITVSPVKDSSGKIIGASKIARDISHQMKAQEQIRKHTQHLEILNSLGKSISKKMDPQLIIQQVIDATTNLTGAAFGAFFYNQKKEGENMMLYTLSGASREDFDKFGMPRSTQIFHPTFAGQGIVRADDITKDSRYGHNAPHFGMPKGHLPVASYLSVPVISGNGGVLGGLIFGHPQPGIFKEEHENLVISIAAQAAISLDNSLLFEQVKSMNDKKDEFIAVASHELKTPLTTIKGYLQVLLQREKDQMSELFLTRSLNQVNTLNNLVEDLLNMSRLDAGALEFSKEVFDLRQLLKDLTETFVYSHKTHELLFDLGDVPVYLEGDQQRIEQAVINLLSNAVKYSPKAKNIYLDLKTLGHSAVISVRDEGIGLTSEEKAQVFARYYRAETTKGISGLGVGLYLTKQIIDRHGGTIEVESEIGKGTEFRFVFSVAEAPTE